MKPLNAVRNYHMLLLFVAAMLFCTIPSFGQPDLPQPTLTVSTTQSLNFGTFSVSGNDGTVTVNWDGSRSSSGGVILYPISPTSQPAVFEIKLCPGRNVTLTYLAATTLTRCGASPLTLHIGPTEKGTSGSTFTTNADCNFVTSIRVGGTLDVPAGATPGSYTGSFSITFNQQ